MQDNLRTFIYTSMIIFFISLFNGMIALLLGIVLAVSYLIFDIYYKKDYLNTPCAVWCKFITILIATIISIHLANRTDDLKQVYDIVEMLKEEL